MKSIPALLLAVAAISASASDLKVIAHYPIPGDVRYDYLRVDPDMRRLYVSHATKVDVLDVDTGAVIGEVAPMKGVHGIALVPGLKRGFITSGGDSTVVMFDLSTLKVLKVITGSTWRTGSRGASRSSTPQRARSQRRSRSRASSRAWPSTAGAASS
jgi:hypothetical protein